MDLVYINSIADLGENQVAYLDATTYNNLSGSTIYMWAKDENENLILDGIEIDFQKSLTKENINSVETITKRIDVKIAQKETETTTVRNEVIDGVEENAKVGYVKITDDQDAKYYYQMVKISESEEYKTLMELAKKIKTEYNGMDMYEKVQIGEQFYNLYSRLTQEAEWKEVENMVVEQPETSVVGDEYIVLLKQINGEEEITDAQFLTSFDDYKPNIVKEQKVTQETAKLPITYDSIALIVALAIIIIAMVVVYIRIRKVSKQDEEK